MITDAVISDIATFLAPGQELNGLRKVNYFFGSNGTGKSTIAKVLANPSDYPTCSVTTQNNCDVVLFNEEFIKRNVRDAQAMPGVFTLGEGAGETADAIEGLELSCANLADQITGWMKTREEEEQERCVISTQLTSDAWAAKLSLGESVREAFAGVNNSRDAFRTRLLGVVVDDPTAPRPIEELQADAVVMFADRPSRLESIEPVVFPDDPEGAWTRILIEPVVASTSSQMSRLIADLSNADWVHAGLSMLPHAHERCPFCQQDIDSDRGEELRAVFDEAYEDLIGAIRGVDEEYLGASARLIASVDLLMGLDHPLADRALLAPLAEAIRSSVEGNARLFAEKLSTPSKEITYRPLAATLTGISALVSGWNEKILENNTLQAEYASRRKSLVDEVWQYLARVGAKPLLEGFRTKTDALTKAIGALTEKITAADFTVKRQKAEMAELRRQMTSTGPTADALNSTLQAFGFDSFKVAVSQGATSYDLVRADGSAASSSLSEGERNFLAFLYFYHLVSGTLEPESAPLARVVLIDDPVSSLDSQVLFVVSALVRKLAARAADKDDRLLRQVIVLTHNAYFHREVTFDSSRGETSKTTERFWRVRRDATGSRVELCETNPVSTGYELLWDEIRRDEGTPNAVANSMRRILEYYFQILGGDKLQDLDQRFDGEDQLVCRVLLSWVNQGSHLPADDMFVAAEVYESEKYRAVFERIFQLTGHDAHYNMMMRLSASSGDGASETRVDT